MQRCQIGWANGINPGPNAIATDDKHYKIIVDKIEYLYYILFNNIRIL